MSLSLKIAEDLIQQKDWPSLTSYCKRSILKFPNSSQSTISVELATYLVKKAIKLCNAHDFNSGFSLQNAIGSMKLKLPSEIAAQLAYDFMNYTSCALRQVGNISKAKIFTEKAIKLCQENMHLCKSTSFINMCAVFSELKRHDKALEYATLAMSSTREEIKILKASNKSEELQEKYTILAIVYYNLAVEQEHFENINWSLQNYQKCHRILKKYCEDRKELIKKVKADIKRINTSVSSRPSTARINTVQITKSNSTIDLSKGKNLKNISLSLSKSQVGVFAKTSRFTSNPVIRENASPKSLPAIKVTKKQMYKSLREKYMNPEHKRKIEISNSNSSIFNTNQILKSKNSLNRTHAAKIIQLQSHIRGYLCREKYRLIRKHPNNSAYRRWKMINGSVYLIKIRYTIQDKLLIIAEQYESKLSLEITQDLSLSEIYLRLGIYCNNLIILPLQFQKKSIYKGKIELNSTIYKLEYYMINEILEIHASSGKTTISTELALPCKYSRPVVRYIIDNIQPRIHLIDDKLVISSTTSTFHSKGFIILNKSRILVEVNLTNTSVEYSFDDQHFTISPIPKSKEIPFILLLSLHKNQYATRSSTEAQQVYSQKLLLNNNFEYYIKVYAVNESARWYYFEASGYNCPPLSGNSYTQKGLKAFYKLSSVKTNIRLLVRRLSAINGEIVLQDYIESREIIECSLSIEKSIIRLQAAYRGHRTRDMIKLQRFDGALLDSCIKNTRKDIQYQINLYKISDHLLVEAYKVASMEHFYWFILDPLDYVTAFFRFSHTKLIFNAIIVDAVPSISTISQVNQYFSQANYSSEEQSSEMTFLHKPEESFLVICFKLPDRNLIIKVYNYATSQVLCKIFSLAEILEVVGRYNLSEFILRIRCTDNIISIAELQISAKSSERLFTDRILYKTSVKVIGVLYQVVAFLVGDDLKFSYKRGSNAGSIIDFYVDLATASKRTGLSEEFVIPIVNFMIKRVLVMKDDRIVMDTSVEPIDIHFMVSRLQAAFRSYIQRKRLWEQLRMKVVATVKKRVEDKVYTVILFEKSNCYLLAAVNYATVFRKYIRKGDGTRVGDVLKSNLEELLVMITNCKLEFDRNDLGRSLNKVKTLMTKSFAPSKNFRKSRTFDKK